MLLKMRLVYVAILALVVHVWMAGAAAACHTCLHAGHAHPPVHAGLSAPLSGAALVDEPAGASAPCPACSYLKAVRGAVLTPPFHPTLPCGPTAVAQYRPSAGSRRPQWRLASRAPPQS